MQDVQLSKTHIVFQENIKVCTCVFLRVWWRPGGGCFWWHLRSLQETSGYSASGKSPLLLPSLLLLPSPLLTKTLCLVRRTGRRGSRREPSRVMLRWVCCLFLISKYLRSSPSMVCLSFCLRVWLSHVFVAFEACLGGGGGCRVNNLSVLLSCCPLVKSEGNVSH